MKVQGDSLQAVQYGVASELGYRDGTRNRHHADRATKFALQYLRQPFVTFAAHENGLTYESHLRKETKKYVRGKMLGSTAVVSWLLSMLIGGIINAVVKLVVEWWMQDTLRPEE